MIKPVFKLCRILRQVRRIPSEDAKGLVLFCLFGKKNRGDSRARRSPPGRPNNKR